MTSEQEAQSRRNGQDVAWRETFSEVLKLLDDRQAEMLLAMVTRNLAVTRGHFMTRIPRSILIDGYLDELERLQVILRERLKFPPEQAASNPDIKLFCSRCDAIVPLDGPLECPFCGRADWLFPTHREGDSDATDA